LPCASFAAAAKLAADWLLTAGFYKSDKAKNALIRKERKKTAGSVIFRKPAVRFFLKSAAFKRQAVILKPQGIRLH